jgi:hypothetical protein
MTPEAFIAKWRDVELSERAASQDHFNELCDAHLATKPRSSPGRLSYLKACLTGGVHSKAIHPREMEKGRENPDRIDIKRFPRAWEKSGKSDRHAGRAQSAAFAGAAGAPTPPRVKMASISAGL